jgi:hypothetical protein
VILKGEVLEIRNVEGRLHIARKPRFHDELDPCTLRGRLVITTNGTRRWPYGPGTVATTG